MRIRATLINVGLLFATLFLLFAGMEIAIRVTGLVSVKPTLPQIYQVSADSRLGYELRPSIRERAFRTTVTTNSVGLRTHVGENPDETARAIAVLGDSFTFGYGVEDSETLPARLQELFPSFRFLNAGVPGYELPQETAFYEDKVAPLKPQALILVFYFNDLHWHEPAVLDGEGNLREPGWTPEEEPDCRPIEEGILGYIPGRCWLDRHSALYVAAKKFVAMRQGQEDLRIQREEAREPDAKDPVTEEELTRYAAQLQAFTATLGDLPRLFVIWPDKLLHTESRPKLKEIAEANGFEVIDLYERFGNEARTLAWDTVHPHPDTIVEAAAFLKPAVEELLRATGY